MQVLKLPILLVLILLLLMFLLHLAGLEVRFVFPAYIEMSLGLFIAGLLIIAVGGFNFRRENTTVNPINPEKTTSLVTSGPYKYSRNPMYIGFLLWVTAGVVYSSNLINIIFPVAFVILASNLYIAREEKALEDIFGDSFRKYKKDVRRWL